MQLFDGFLRYGDVYTPPLRGIVGGYIDYNI